MQNFTDLVQGNFFKIVVEQKRGKNVRFSTINWRYFENGEKYDQDYY